MHIKQTSNRLHTVRKERKKYDLQAIQRDRQRRRESETIAEPLPIFFYNFFFLQLTTKQLKPNSIGQCTSLSVCVFGCVKCCKFCLLSYCWAPAQSLPHRRRRRSCRWRRSSAPVIWITRPLSRWRTRLVTWPSILAPSSMLWTKSSIRRTTLYSALANA